MPSNTSPEIDSELKQALGNRKPAEAWQDIVAAVQEFSLDNPGAWDSEAEWWSHVEPYEARGILERADPVKALTFFHEIHPGIDLQNLSSLGSSFLAEAALHIFAEVGT